MDEKLAIATEALFSLGGADTTRLSSEIVKSIARQSLEGYSPEEGARSLYRAVSGLLLDIFDSLGDK